MSSPEEKLSRYFSKQLRRFFYRSPVRAEVYRRYKTSKGYLCLYCSKHFKSRKELQIEHVKPAVPVELEYVSAGERLIRMFNFQIINDELILSLENLVLACQPCHKTKSKYEMSLRAKHGTGPYSKKAKERRKAKCLRRSKKS